MVIPTQNVIVYGTLSGVYGLICLASICILIRVIMVDMKHRQNYTKFIRRRFGFRRRTITTTTTTGDGDDHQKEGGSTDDDETASLTTATTPPPQEERQSTFSDKRLMFALICILSAVRSTQLAIQGSVIQFSEYRELLIIVSSMPGYVFASLMLMMIFFWTETLILPKRLLYEERKQHNNDNNNCTSTTGIAADQPQSSSEPSTTESTLCCTSWWFLAFITSSRFLKWLFFSINFIMYFVMVVNDSLLIYQFAGDSNHTSDYTDPTPYSAIEIVAVSMPTLLFIGCALLIFILGLILLRKYYKNYKTFSNTSALYIIFYIGIVTVTDIVVLIGRSSVLIAQIFLSWLETQWITIFCYFTIGEVIPLIILNFALWKMSSSNNNSANNGSMEKTVVGNETSLLSHGVVNNNNKKVANSNNNKVKIKSMSRAAEYYTHWDDSTEDAAVYINREDYDNATERDIDSSTHSSSPQTGAGGVYYGSTSDQKSHKSRSGSSSGGGSMSQQQKSRKISNPIPYHQHHHQPPPAHSLINKVDSTMIGNNSLRNAYNDFTGVSD